MSKIIKWLIIIAIALYVFAFIIVLLCDTLEQWIFAPCMIIPKMIDYIFIPLVLPIICGVVIFYIIKSNNSDYKEAKQLYDEGKYDIAFSKLKELAEKGHKKSQFDIALMYQLGLGSNENYDEAIKWYSKVAKKGNLEAQNNLGSIYRFKEDYDKAIKWYSKAAKRGSPEAQDNLGQMYQSGLGVSRDYKKAIEWYNKAIKQGYNEAKNSLAGMYANGWGVEQDLVKAEQLTLEAIKAGDTEAQSNMGLLYNEKAQSQNEKKDKLRNEEEAFKWFSLAAKQGDVQAQYGVAVAYYHGIGVEKSFIKSYMWFTIAISGGEPIKKEKEAKYCLQELVRRMTFAEITKAKEMAKRCMESGYKDCG